MASILVEDLNPLGLSLFGDRESYLTHLGDEDLTSASVQGGLTPVSSIACPLVVFLTPAFIKL